MLPTARGTAFLGLLVSAATSPEFSEPDMAKIQVGMTERKPLKPLIKGSEFQYRKPIFSPGLPAPADVAIAVCQLNSSNQGKRPSYR